MKRFWRVSIFLVFVVCLSGCQELSRQTEYILDNNIQFSLPKIWEQVESDEFDLALTKTTAELIINAYHQADLDGISASQLLDQKIQEKMEEMSDYRLMKDYKVNEVNDRKIYSKLYTANKDGIEKQYYFSVMEFVGTHTYIYALYEAKETYMKYNIDDIQRMLIRMKWNDREEDLALN